MRTKYASTRFSIVKRSKGQSAVDAASYISRSVLVSEYDGKTYRPKYHEDLVHCEINLPEYAPEEWLDRAVLWNSVELNEKQKNAQLCRTLKAALPNDWSYELAEETVRDYVQRNFVSKGMCADWAIHDSVEELLQRLQAAGYEIKPGKYVSCRAPGQERFTRLKTLGADYTEEAIRERIAGRRAKAAKAPREQRGVSLLIDIENSIKAAQSKGYEQWAKIHNLKQAAKTMNFLTEHKIEQYADLVSRIEEMAAESGQAADALKDAEKRLADMAVLIKNVSTYQKTKPVYDAYRKARNREKYRAGQEQAIILHEAAARSLKAAGIAKLPNLAALQSEYEALQAQKEALYADYGKLKKKVREYDIIKQNIDSILQADRQPEREKGTERG